MKNYFEFIIYLAFENVLMLENKRNLTIEQLHNYRMKLCEKHIQYYSKYDEYASTEFEERLKSFHKKNLNTTFIEESYNFAKFIKENAHYFTFHDNTISLKDHITIEELQKLFALSSCQDWIDELLCGDLISFHDSIECLEALDIQKIKPFISRIVENEKKIEIAYLTYKDTELEEKIKDLCKYELYTLALINQFNDIKMGYYQRYLSHLGNIDIKDNKSISLLSDTLMNNDQFYNINEEYIDYLLYENHYHKAIFDNETLVSGKLDSMIDAMWDYRDPNAEMETEPDNEEDCSLIVEERLAELEAYHDEYEDEEDLYEEDYIESIDLNRIELYLYNKNVTLAFYLRYIIHLDEYCEKVGVDEILEHSKARLLYILDNYGENLYKTENFIRVLNSIPISTFDYKEDFDDYYMLSRLFLVDILEGWIDDEYTTRKVLFISTYYDLTKDKRIDKIINKYRKTELGKKISEIIYNHDYQKLSGPSLKLERKSNKKNK